MFTGIIEEMGVIQGIDRRIKSARLSILARIVLEDLSIGDSIMVNGVCLTAAEKREKEFTADISPETLTVTDLGSLKTGDAVNLERAMRVNSRLGGHLVTGHIDGVGRVRERNRNDDALLLSIEMPPDLMRYCIKKGSIAVDGVSLTVAALRGGEFDVMVVPYTWEHTSLHALGPRDRVNLECDMVGKYVVRTAQIAMTER